MGGGRHTIQSRLEFQYFIYLASLGSAEDSCRVRNDVEHFIYVEECLIMSSKSPRSKYHCVEIDVFETVKDS